MLAMTTVVAVPCRRCNEVTELKVDFEGFTKWQQGELIQNALPELDVDQRELLISGTCPTCWDEMFPSDEEQELLDRFRFAGVEFDQLCRNYSIITNFYILPLDKPQGLWYNGSNKTIRGCLWQKPDATGFHRV